MYEILSILLLKNAQLKSDSTSVFFSKKSY